MPGELVNVHGIIFKRQKYKEADLLVKILTKEMGIFTFIAKGALKPKSKSAGAVLTFSEGDYVVYTKKAGISTLRTFKKVKTHDELYSDLLGNAYVTFIFDLLDHAFVEYQPVDKYYDLVSMALTHICEKQDPEVITQIVQMQMLEAFGVMPQLRYCVFCGKSNGEFDYSIKSGGIVCKDHFAQSSRLHLQPKTVSYLRTIGLLPFQRLGSIKISDQTKKESSKTIDKIYDETVQLNLRTKKFLDELKLL